MTYISSGNSFESLTEVPNSATENTKEVEQAYRATQYKVVGKEYIDRALVNGFLEFAKPI